ncbi:hypothetical protein [Klebsiella variicola]|uniref:hypothetical protein n=1 Tax=Klebsiella variicola TaxID=244366 RepID=UPI0034DF5452
MSQKLSKRSEIEKQLASGEAVKEPPRQAIRNTITGRIISNERAAETLPTYLITMQSNTLIYNDVDVEAFSREVRQQVTKILDAIKDERFKNAGIGYQQFIDLYDACFEMPSEEELRVVKRHGTELYAILEHHGNQLSEELGIKNLQNGEAELRFYAITDAHINLFFHMLTLNLEIHNRIYKVQTQLRSKLGFLEERLRKLLREYIYANSRGFIYQDNLDKSETLYGWILLQQNDLDTAREIYNNDLNLQNTQLFTELHAEVMKIYLPYTDRTPAELRENAFRGCGLSDARVRIAKKLCHYLQQTAQIREYLDELTLAADNQDMVDATVDVQSHLINHNQ